MSESDNSNISSELRVPELTVEVSEKTDRSRSVSEAKGIADENLEDIARRNNHHRQEKIKNHFTRVVICVMWAILITGGGVTLALFIHYATPWSFLTPDQASKLSNTLVSVATGVVGTLGGKFLVKNLE